MNFIYLFLFFISTIFIIYSYGFVLEKLLNLSNNNYNLGEKGIYAISFLLSISLIIHFFIPINYQVTIPIFLFGLLILIRNIKYIFYEINFIKIEFLSLVIILFPFIFIKNFHDDFNYYHLPYLNVVFSHKIIFGLGNLNNILIYPQNAWLDFISLFKLPIFENNIPHILNASIFFFFIIFNVEKFKQNNEKLLKSFNALLIILAFVLFSRLKDFGLEIIPQLILLLVTYFILEIYINKEINVEKNIEKILIFSMTAILLRIGSVSILPVVLIVLINFYKQTLNIFFNYKLILYCLLTSIVFFMKNIIISGCLIYPLSFTCVEESTLSWSIGKEIPEINKNVLHSFSRGWMFYAKEETETKEKFIFNPTKMTMSHKEYMDKNLIFWSKYWFKDPDTIRILNLILISFFIIIIFLIFNYYKITFIQFSKKTKKLYFVLILFIPQVVFWFLIGTPSMRLGGYAALIPIVLVLILIIISKILIKDFEIKKSIIVLLSISSFYFFYKNIDRVLNDYNNKNFNFNQPWPLHENLLLNEDYKINKIDGININLRLPTNKLLMGNLEDTNNYILHCGNIDMLCTPVKKFKCIKKIEKIKGYILIKKDLKKCLDIYKSNVLY